MFPLPPSLEVSEDAESEKELLEKVKAWLEKDERPEGIHASDILAPRKAYWRLLDPQPLSTREVGLYLVGKVLHSFVLGALEGTIDLNKADEGSRYSEDLGIFCSPDKIFRGAPAELKTSRAFYTPRTVGDLDTYVRQLLVYMAEQKVTEGRLWVLYVNARDESQRTSPQFRCFKVNLPEPELEAVILNIKSLRNGIVDAVRTRDHRPLPLCEDWMCKPEQCGWWAKCRPDGRYENPDYLKKKK